jgi:enoyl-CoA hydratase/carnithine racemase
MSSELRDAVDALAGDPDVRVVVLRGAGDRAFMSGADFREGRRAFAEKRRPRFTGR